MEDKRLGMGDWIKGIFFLVISFTGAFTIGNLIFPDNPQMGGSIGLVLWVIFTIIALNIPPGRSE